MKFRLTAMLLFFSGNIIAQCDSSFYTFKREILTKVLTDLQVNIGIKVPAKTVSLEFSDYQRFSYMISDSKSTLGFVCMRNETCNNFSDSFCLKNGMNENAYRVEKSLFENFMTSDDLVVCGIQDYFHTLAKLIENPIGGWGQLEYYYFNSINNPNTGLLYRSRSILLTFPVYVLLDKKLKKVFLYYIEITGTKQESILIKNRQVIETR